MASPAQRSWREKLSSRERREEGTSKNAAGLSRTIKKTEHVTTDSDLSITWSRDCILLSENKLQFIHFKKSSGLYQANHISHMLILSDWKFSKLPESEKSPLKKKFSLIISNPKSLSCVQGDKTKTKNVFCIPTGASLWLCTHGNPPMATARARLQEQEWVCVYLRWDTQALHAAKSVLFSSFVLPELIHWIVLRKQVQ